MWTYTSLPSAMEPLLLLDATGVAAEVLRRGADGNWPEDPEEVGPDGVLALESVGLRVPLRDLHRGTSLAPR